MPSYTDLDYQYGRGLARFGGLLSFIMLTMQPVINTIGDGALPLFMQQNEERLATFKEKQGALLIEIAERRQKINAKSTHPQVGDIIEMPNGEYMRVCHDWDDSVQLTEHDGSFYMWGSGHASYSGGLRNRVPNEAFEKTTEERMGRMWFFADHRGGASRGIYCSMPFLVWKLINLDLAPKNDYAKYAKAG